MQTTIILTIGGIFWILTYIFIISKGFKDKTYGMPIIALCANISWEFIFSFILPSSPPQLFINYLWFGLDTIIVFQFFKYYKDEFPSLSSLKVFITFGLLIITAFSLILSNTVLLNDHRGVYAAFVQNLLMSILFIVMFFKRGKGLRGQSIFVAVFKMLGTGLTSIYFYLYEPVAQSSFILPLIFALIFVFDFLYVLLIASRYQSKSKRLESKNA
jgi:hypothetical protein